MPGDYEALERQLRELPEEIVIGYIERVSTVYNLERTSSPQIALDNAKEKLARAQQVLVGIIREREIFVNSEELTYHLLTCAREYYRERRSIHEAWENVDDELKEVQHTQETKLRLFIEKGLKDYLN